MAKADNKGQPSLWDQLFGFKRGSGAGNAKSKAANARVVATTKANLTKADQAHRAQNNAIQVNKGQDGVTRAAQSTLGTRQKTAATTSPKQPGAGSADRQTTKPAKKTSVKKAAGDGALAGGIGQYGTVGLTGGTPGTPSVTSYINLPGAPGATKTAAKGFKSDPQVAKLIAAIGGNGGLVASKFDGNLQDYVQKYRSMMPTVGYGALIDNAKQQADTSDQKIQGVTNGLSAYISGLAGGLTDQSKATADQLASGTQSAVDILNSAYDASRKSVSDQLANIGGFEGVNPDPAGIGAQHQQAAVGDMAARLQTAQTANANDLSSRLAFNQTAGASAQMQGAEQRASLQQQLAKLVAGYRTQESQENASNAAQALSMGTSQFNNDRSFAQSEASRAQDQANQAYAQRVNAANMAINQDQTRYGRFRDTVGDEQAAAQQRYAAAVDAAKFRYSQQQDAASAAASAASAGSRAEQQARSNQLADAKFQLEVDKFNQSKATAATKSAAPQGLSKTAATLWSSTYNAVLNKTGKLTQAQAAANTAVKNAGY